MTETVSAVPGDQGSVRRASGAPRWPGTGDPLPQTIPEALALRVRTHAESLVVIDGDVRLSYAELGDAVMSAARALIASGVGLGDRVAIWAANSARWIVTALAIYSAGAVLVPLNTRYKGEEAADIVGRSGARLVFTSDGFLGIEFTGMLRRAGVSESDAEVVGLTDSPAAVRWADFLARAAAVTSDAVRDRGAHLDAYSTSDILFTSGTTGRPKGAMLAHGASVRAYGFYAWRTGMRTGDRYLLVNPLSHAFGLKGGLLANLLAGATLVVQQAFDPEAVMGVVPREGITFLPGTPALFLTLLNHPRFKDADMSSVRSVSPGGAVVPEELIARLRAEIGVSRISRGYGLTEATGLVASCDPEADAATIAESCGAPIDDIEVRIVDTGGTVRAAGDSGEVQVRGYNVMQGYFGDPEATADAIDEDGWLSTGDIGLIDDKGSVRIVDRLKDMYLVGGFNAYPAEIERVMLQHEAIAQVAVVGVPDERLGEVGTAFVVPRTGARLDEASVIAWCRERLANFKVPRSLTFVDSLPVNASGKVLKTELRRRVHGK
jgi:acyl-CoA synthetase (AMP-forming)/AMP-acid ligase II